MRKTMEFENDSGWQFQKYVDVEKADPKYFSYLVAENYKLYFEFEMFYSIISRLLGNLFNLPL